jgi:plastocyanin
VRRWLVLALVLWPAAEALGAQTATHDVAARNNAFDPSTVRVAPHDTVRWTNHDSTAHTVTFEGEEAAPLPAGGQHADTFPTPGTYRYRCDFHPGMTGSVVVQGSSTSTTSSSTTTTTRGSATTSTTAGTTTTTTSTTTSTSTTTTTTMPFLDTTTTVAIVGPGATGVTDTDDGGDDDNVDVPGGIAAALLLLTAAAALLQARGGLS